MAVNCTITNQGSAPKSTSHSCSGCGRQLRGCCCAQHGGGSGSDRPPRPGPVDAQFTPPRPYRQGFPLRPLHLGESRPAASPAESHAPALPALRGAPRTSGLNLTDPSSSGAGGCGNAAPLTAATRSASSSSSSSARPAKRARLRSGRHLAGPNRRPAGAERPASPGAASPPRGEGTEGLPAPRLLTGANCRCASRCGAR